MDYLKIHVGRILNILLYVWKPMLYNGISEEMQNGYEQKKFISNECLCFIIKITLNNFFKM